MCHMLCHVSPITCALLIVPTATVADPPAAYSPTMHSSLICKDPQQNYIFEVEKSLKQHK